VDNSIFRHSRWQPWITLDCRLIINVMAVLEGAGRMDYKCF